MGTNYYHRTNICDCCGRYDTTHICKSLTTFEAVRFDDTITVGSWQEWKARLLAGGRIFDEYGREHKVEEFIADVEATDPFKRGWQYEWMVEHMPASVSDTPESGKDWRDADGFSFTGGEFS